MDAPQVRSEIIDTGNSKVKAARIVINASPAKIFSILNNPKRHRDIDGSSTIRSNISGPQELILGSRFGMKIQLWLTLRKAYPFTQLAVAKTLVRLKKFAEEI